ncbi:MAG: porin [Desulfobacteraceae bacterium]|nr:porin [Desulfobacteraceae bacterium]
MKNMRTRVVLGMLATLLVVPFMAQSALALEAKLSGQVDQMVMWADDGKQSNAFVTDNDASSTRFRFTGEEALGAVKAGFQIEIEAQRNPSNRLAINTNNDNSYTSTDNNGFEFQDRWLNAYFTTKFGTVEIGKGDSAANNTAEVDLSGTSVVTYSDILTSAGGFTYALSNGNYTNLTIAQTRSNFDGPLSRSDRLRYNTPNFAGFTGSVAAENGGAYDAGVFYAADIYGKLAGAIGYTNPMRQVNGTTNNPDWTQWAASVSWLAPFGLNLTGSYGMRDVQANNNASSYYIKAGYLTGIHAFSIEYSATMDYISSSSTGSISGTIYNYAKGTTGSTWGATYVIKPWAPVELYAAYRIYSLSLSSSAKTALGIGNQDVKDINEAMVGTRIKF